MNVQPILLTHYLTEPLELIEQAKTSYSEGYTNTCIYTCRLSPTKSQHVNYF